MQVIGVDCMLEKGMEEELICKGIPTENAIKHKEIYEIDNRELIVWYTRVNMGGKKIMGLFSKKIGQIFLKETGDAEVFIEKMEKLQERAGGAVKKEIEKQLKIARYGELGERNIAFELKNSGIDMYVLHDLFLEEGALSAQIDYIVITRKHIFIIECKNLIGNIEIDNTGAFIRSFELYGKKVREGIYSPITQNQRHLMVLKEIVKSSKSNFITKAMFEKSFEQNYKSIVVLANPKTCLNARFAPKEIKNQVIRADQLISYIKEQEKLGSEVQSNSSEEMRKLAEFFLEQNRPNQSDYAKKYEEIVAEMEKEKSEKQASEGQNGKPEKLAGDEESKNTEEMINLEKESEEFVDGEQNKKFAETVNMKQNEKTEGQKEIDIDANKQEELVQRLKKFRLEQSRKEKVKPYYIFNDAQMRDLIEKNPKNNEELLEVSGFGKIKVEKYAEEIFKILSE